MIEVIHAGNDVNLPGLATTKTVAQHVNLNYFSEAVSWEVEARLADADSRRITLELRHSDAHTPAPRGSKSIPRRR